MGPLAPNLGVVCTPCHYVFGTFWGFSMYGFRQPRVAHGGDPYRDLSGATPTHHVLQHNAPFEDDFSFAAHEDPRSKILFMDLRTVLVPVVTQILVFFPK